MIEEQDTGIPEKKNYRSNWLFMAAVVLIMVFTYLFFKRDLYLYVCEKEQNAPACYVLSGIYLEDGDTAKAQKYLELSCQNKYELACKKLGKE